MQAVVETPLIKKIEELGDRDLILGAAYFISGWSVGEILAEIELRLTVKEPHKVILQLLDRGIIRRGPGCYNLSEELREEIRRIAAARNKLPLDVAKEIAAQIRRRWR